MKVARAMPDSLPPPLPPSDPAGPQTPHPVDRPAAPGAGLPPQRPIEAAAGAQALGPADTSTAPPRPASTRRAFTIIWLALFMATAALTMVSPLLPKFATDMGAAGIWVGLAYSGYTMAQIPLMPLVGRLSDRMGKRNFVWIGMLIVLASAVGYYFSPDYKMLLVFRIICGAGAALIFPISFAYIGELSPPGHEGRYLGILNIAWIAGFGIGPAVGGNLYDTFGMDAAFIAMGILAASGFVMVFMLLPPSGSVTRTGTSGEFKTTPYLSMLKSPDVRGLVSFRVMLGLGYGMIFAFIPVFLTDFRGAALGQVGIMLSLRYVLNGTMSYPCGWFADRTNRTTMVALAAIAMAALIFMIPSVGGFAFVFPLFVAIGLFESIALAGASAIAVDAGRRLGMGSIMGLLETVFSATILASSMIGGVVQDSLGIEWVFRVAAAGVCLVTVAFFLNMRRVPRPGMQPATSLPWSPREPGQ